MYLNNNQLFQLGQLYACLNILLQNKGKISADPYIQWHDPYPLSDAAPYKYFIMTLVKAYHIKIPAKIDNAIGEFFDTIDANDNEALIDDICPMKDRIHFIMGRRKFFEIIKESPIRTARLNAALTQSKLAEKIGVEQKDISRWENNVCKPNAENLAKLSEALNCSVDYLLKGEN